MTRDEFEHWQTLTERLRTAAESGIAIASELRRSGALWTASLVSDARRLLNTVDYFEQEQRRLVAEVARLPEHNQLAPQPQMEIIR